MILAEPATPIQSHCKRGHELIPENLVWSVNGRYTCKPCRARKQALRRARVRRITA